jgi:filamentous hemagglutinin
VADAAALASQRPTVTTSPTGVDMVNIAAPNSAGLSYNRYQRFDVGSTGLLLNNSTVPLTTLLGPIIATNSNLGGRSASLIVNEVVTALPSQLNGPLAVLGDPAKVIIANPNGITCNGCSFLNTTQVQLSTGNVGFRDAAGAPTSFDAATGITLQVASGQIRIDGAGLSSPLARLDLIAETISTNGPVIVSGALNLLAGRQTVDAQSLAILAAGAGNSKVGIGQDWAVDATAFGAMNAGSISIVATSAGMGVRSAAQLAASGGDLAINANGDLTLANAAASRDMSLTATGAAANGGLIAAGRNLSLSAASLDNRNQTIVAQGGDLTLAATGAIDNNGGILAASGGLLLTAGSLNNTGGGVQAAAGNLDLGVTGLLDNNGGMLAGAHGATIQAGSFSNVGGNLIAYAGDLTLTATGAVDNGGGLIAASNGLTLTAGSLNNAGGNVQAAGGDLNLNVIGQLDNSQGAITADQGMSIQAGSASNVNGNLIAYAGDLTLNSIGALDNSGGLIAASRGLTLTAASLDNTGGTVQAADGNLGLGVAGQLDNTGGTVAASQSLTIQAGSVANANGNLTAYDGDLILTATGAVDNSGGLIAASGALTLTAASLANANSIVQASGGNLDIGITGMLDNNGGMLAGGHGATIRAGSFLNVSGNLIAYAGDLTLTGTGGVDNTNGLIVASNALTIMAASFGNGGGTVQAAGGDVGLNIAGLLDNNGGTLAGAHGATVQAGSFSNIGGNLIAYAGNLTLTTTGAVDNSGGLIAASNAATLTAASLDNASGTVHALGGDLDLSVAGQLDSSQGTIAAGQGLAIQADSVLNTDGNLIAHTGDFTLTATGAVDNSGGLIVASNGLTFAAASLANVGGTVQASGGNVSLHLAGQLDNSQGAITAGQGMAVQAGSALNVSGNLIAYAGDLTLAASGAVDNSGGLIAATNGLTAAAASLNSTGGLLQTDGNLSFTLTLPGGSFNLSGAQSGTFSAGGVLTIHADTLANTGSFGHAGALILTADSQLTNTGVLASGGHLILDTAGQFQNNGFLYTGGNFTVAADSFINTGGITIDGTGNFTFAHAFDNRLAASIDLAGALNLAAASIVNAGSLATQGSATLSSGTLVNGGTLAAGTTITAQGTTSIANAGTMASGGDASLTTANLSNTGTVSSNGSLVLAAPTFANSGQVVATNNLTLGAATGFTNSGTVSAGNDATVTLGSAASNANGSLVAGNDLTLTTTVAGAFGGNVGANRDVILHLADYTNGAGETDFGAGRNLTVTANSLTNAGALAAYQDLSITTTGGLINSGQLLAGRDAAFAVGGTFTNTGAVETGRDLAVSAAALSNGSGGGATVQSFGESASMADYRAWVLTYIDDPVIQGKLFNEITPDWQGYNSRFYLLNRWSYFMDSGLIGPYFSLTITRSGSSASISAGRNLAAQVTGTLANNSSSIAAGGNLTLNAANFQNAATQDSYQGVARAGGGGHTLVAYGNGAAGIRAGGAVAITAPTQTNTGTIQGSSVYLGGSLVNGLTDYNQPTPATTLPHAVIDLSGAPIGAGSAALPIASATPATGALPATPATPATPGLGALPATPTTPATPALGSGTPSFPAPPAGATFTPTAPTVFSSAVQLSLLAPVGQSYLLGLLPPELRPGSTTFLMDAWLEQQTLRQAAMRETGQSTFLAGLAYDDETGLGVDSQQRALLYQNAARFATDNNVKLGGALSEAQQIKLTEPLLWYVEETITGPDGKTLTALVPKLYLPAGQLDQWANVAGGVIRGQNVTLDAGAGTIDNTGYVVAGNTLTVNASELVNRARSAAWGSYTQDVEGGLLEVWGDRVQPGGFLSAAKLDLNVGRVASVSGEFLQGGTEVSGQLASRLGANYSRSENRDNVYTEFHADESMGLDQLVVMAVAIAVSVYTAGAASGAIAAAAESSAVAAGTVAAGTSAATAVGTAAASSAWGVAASSAAGAMASSAVTGALTGNFSMDNVLKSGLTAGLTAGLTQGLGFNEMAGVKDVGGGIVKGTYDAAQLGNAALGIAGRGVVNAGVNTAIYGGSFGEAFRQSVISDAAAVGANAIGQTWGGGQNPAMQTLAHAGLGAAAAALRGQDAVAGAIGGATESALGNLVDVAGGFDKTDNTNRALYAGAATLAGGLVANAAGHDSLAAAQTAQNAAVNNYLEQKPTKGRQKSEQQIYDEARADCFKTGNQLACGLATSLGKTSKFRDDILASNCADGATGCNTEVRAAIASGNKIVQLGNGVVTATSPGTPYISSTPNPVSTLFDTTFQGGQSQNLGQGLAITGAAVATVSGGAALYDMGVAAQTMVLLDGVAGVSARQWTTSIIAGGTISMGTNWLVNPNASPASLSFSALSGALGGMTKLGLNAAAGLANQWIPTTVGNLITYGSSWSVSNVISNPNSAINQSVNPNAGTSAWTSPVFKCGSLPQNPC